MKIIHWIMLFTLFLVPFSGCATSSVRSQLSPQASVSGYQADVYLVAASKASEVYGGDDPSEETQDEDLDFEEEEEEEPEETIADPLEPVNRVFFYFNDKLYFWVLKPVATGYKAVLPQGVRVSVRNFFSNLLTPIRFVNTLLQGDPEGAAIELTRFFVNTTVGLGGFFDPAAKYGDVPKQDVDFGQTLGIYGLNPGFYIVLPIFGPSSLRDGVGLAVDAALNPMTYLFLVTPIGVSTGLAVHLQVNEVSLTLGDYESLKEAALDPYIALRNAYFQYRRNKIKERSLAKEREKRGPP